MPDPVPLSLLCLAPAIPIQGEDLIITFRVPPVQYARPDLGWSILLEKWTSKWEASATLTGTFTGDMEVQRLTCPLSRFVRLTVEYQGGPAVFEFETRLTANPPNPNAWVSRQLASEPCPWMIYHGRTYQNGVEVNHPATGYFAPAQVGDSWVAVESDGSTGARLVSLTVTGGQVMVYNGPDLIGQGPAALGLAGSYELTSGELLIISSVRAPSTML